MKNFSTALFAFVAPMVVFAACATTTEPPKPTLTPAEEAQANAMRVEVDLGRNMAGRLLASYGMNRGKQPNDYLALIGTYLSATGDFPGYRFAFGITDNASVTGYSCPGGYILVSKGAIAAAENEAELAGVVAHELSHVVRKHVLQVIQKRSAPKETSPKADDPEVKMREREKSSSNSETGNMLARYLMGANGAALSIAAATRSGLFALVEEGLDHDMEFEADKDALAAMMHAGYDGSAYIAYLSRLEKNHAASVKATLDKTHPSLTLRIEKLTAQYKDLKAQAGGVAKGADRFKRMTEVFRAGNENTKVR